YSDAGTSNIAIDNFTVFNGPILNIPDESAAKFKLNTISKGISLEITNIKNSVKVDIYDALGRRVRNTEIRSTGSYNINGLEPGIYFVILSRDINYRGKVLIVK
ncbi:MAG: T9SS type A sorting domain-containing protein, partial [Candidatus Hydrothermia bacterium]|nr:T9SS type A sorting domain-containing protein [Candidatus Hydrothermia bacterium]